MSRIEYFDYKRNVFAEMINPSVQDVQYRLDALGEYKEHHFNINTSFGSMGITEASEDRVLIIVYLGLKAGTLLDPSYPIGSREIEIVGDPDGSPRTIRQTIPKAKAYEIATYFLENETLPKGLSWSGNLDELSE